jgi:hypothetical protein
MKFDVPELGLFNVQATLQLQPAQPPKSNLAKQASEQANAGKGLYWYSETFVEQKTLPEALNGLPLQYTGLRKPCLKEHRQASCHLLCTANNAWPPPIAWNGTANETHS